ncbi:helix-turn-helix domain-containing protein [Streptomyces sp. CG1]|uniref:helix-turn-helix domain-containing protein n=1 Tax=Streptomyces sp. CG1 TaxID=1287523 RepID=UPI0034E1C8EE
MIASIVRTSDLPSADRFAWWRKVIDDDLTPTRTTSEHSGNFRAQAVFLGLDCIQVSDLTIPTLQCRRTPTLIRRCDPERYQLALVKSGLVGMTRCRSEARLQAGDFILYDTSHPFDFHAIAEHGSAQLTIMHLPRAALSLPANRVAPLLGQRMGAAGTGAILASCLDSLVVAALADSLSVRDATRLGPVVRDLATAFLGHHADAEDHLPPEPRQQALISRIQAFIEHRLGDPGLSPAVIAEAHHISVRYLHKLFERQDATVAAWIRRRRLDRCRHDLGDPALATRSVHAIAARWGFTRADHFNRTFRAEYGATPGEYRRAISAGHL